MEKSELYERINELVDDPDFIAGVKRECRKLIESGAVDIEKETGPYGLAKTILAVALENAGDYVPRRDNRYYKIYKNLQKI